MTVLLVAVGAGLGAALRFALSSWLDRPELHRGTWAVNVAGSFVIGVLSGAAVGPATSSLLATGFCGGLTTYSSFAVQTHQLGVRRGALYAVTTLAPALAACALGVALGSSVR